MKHWNRQSLQKEEGQALIQVSIALIVLLGFAALAIDIGFGYAQRRSMQNAADAGALAGAYQMCFVDPTQSTVESVAQEYATVRNLAQLASVDLSHPGVAGGLITVTTESTMPTFLAGVIGQPEITAGARAVAACGAANSGCGLSPIGFSHAVYETLACDEIFYVWDDNRIPATSDCTTTTAGDYTVLSGGDRGWLQFPRPEEPYPDEYGCADNCGAQQLKCIVEHDYDGQIDVSPSPDDPICLPGQSGVAQSIGHEIDNRIAANGGNPYQSNILLYDLSITCNDDDMLGTCSGSPFPSTGLGCVNIMGTATINACGLNNVKVIMAQKSCDCDSTCGRTDGTPGSPGDLKAVNLLK